MCLGEKTCKLGFGFHYTYHPAWAARVLARTKPARHIDIGSTINFVVIISAFIKTDYYEYRPAEFKLDNLSSHKADLLCLPFEDSSVESLSCMHAIEHIGLGRYGAPIDPNGDLKAIAELKRVLADGGSLLVVVPVGRPRIKYNAERIYSYEMIMDYFRDLKLREYLLITDEGDLVYSALPKMTDSQFEGCGCFWFMKE